VTVTDKLHDSEVADESVPFVNAIVFVPESVSVPPLQAMEVPFVRVNPVGSTSVKVTLVKAAPEFGFVSVNVKFEVEPVAIGSGENTLDMVGLEGMEHPVKLTLSIYKSDPGLLFLALDP
jgi:hypothetical protein